MGPNKEQGTSERRLRNSLLTSFRVVASRFDEETTVLESYEVVCLMHAPARRPSTDHTCLLDIKAFGYYG